MDLGGFSLTGPREANEDSYFFQDFSSSGSLPRDINAFVMVSDGMGGYQGGDVASSLAVEAAQSYLAQLVQLARGASVDIDPLAAMAEIVQRAHDAIMIVARERGGASMGATFVGAFLSPSHAWIGHVGDSRAYLIRDGEALQLTEDHSQVGRMLSRGVITEEEAQNHPNRNRIERALGFPNYEIEFDEVDLEDGDALLLCSDGVYTVVKGTVLAECVEEMGNAPDAAQEVANEAIASGTDDNSTVVIAAGFSGASSRPASKRVTTLTGAEGIKPVPERKSAVRTLTDFDGVEPVRDYDPMPESMTSAQRRSAGQRTRRQRSATDRREGERRASDRYDSDPRADADYRSEHRPARSRDAAQRRSGSHASQGQGGRVRRREPLPQSSRTRRPAAYRDSASRGSASRAQRDAHAPQSRFTWRTAILIGVIVIAIAIIALLVFNTLAGVKPADDSTSIATMQSSNGDQAGVTAQLVSDEEETDEGSGAQDTSVNEETDNGQNTTGEGVQGGPDVRGFEPDGQ